MTPNITSCDQLASLDFNSTIALIEEICRSGQLVLKNPISQQLTRCVASAQRGISNILKFADGDGQNVWYLVQISSFIDAWVCDDKFHCYEYSATVKGTTKKMPHWIKSGVISFESHGSDGRQITGILVSGNRPYHYLHDRYVYAFELSLHHNLGPYCFRNRKCFIKELPSPSGHASMQSRPSKGCFIAPCIRKDQLPAQALEQASSFLTELYQAPRVDRFDGLTLWLGITSQANRRMWLEQIEGYICYAKYVAQRSKRTVRVFIDGWTSYAENSPPETEIDSDQALANKLIAALNEQELISATSLVGRNYQYKIACAMKTDLAITNDCSGSLITNTICRRPSILHGNKVIRSCSDEQIHLTTKFVDYEKIQPIPGPKPSNTDYSMSWELLIPATEELLTDHLNSDT